MKPLQIWAKASLATRCSLSNSSGPLWVGVEVDTGVALASTRWDIPAGYGPLIDVIEADQKSSLIEDITAAKRRNKPDDHVCYAIPKLSLEGPAPHSKAGGQFGQVLDARLLASLDSIAPADMAWITDDTRRELHNSFTRLSARHIELILWAIHRAGLSVSVSPPSGAAFRFVGVQLSEA